MAIGMTLHNVKEIRFFDIGFIEDTGTSSRHVHIVTDDGRELDISLFSAHPKNLTPKLVIGASFPGESREQHAEVKPAFSEPAPAQEAPYI